MAQSDAALVATVPIEDPTFRRRFETLLFDPRAADLALGWRLARSLGPAVGPLLWDLHGDERLDKRRWVALLAALATNRGVVDDRVYAAIENKTAEQFLCCLWIALGDPLQSPRPTFWGDVLGRRSAPSSALQVAALLASARVPEAAGNAPVVRSSEVGLLAAAAVAGARAQASLYVPFHRVTAAPAHAELVWRGEFVGALLGAAAVPDELRDLAREVFALPGPADAPWRLAAATLLARAGALDPGTVRPTWRQLCAMIVDQPSAEALARWLGPLPEPLEREHPEPLAVAYALAHPIATVLEQRAQWGGEPLVARHVAVALAWRLLGEQGAQPIDFGLPNVPEWYLVRWASGSRVDKAATIDDPVLEQAAMLAKDQRIDRATMRRVLEETLWRWGGHPGLAVFEAHRLIVRDLLLTGSYTGMKYEKVRRAHDVYLPDGFGRENVLYELAAVPAFEFFSAPTLPIPRECRLR